MPDLESASLLVVIRGLLATVTGGSVSFRGDLGSQLLLWSWYKPRTCGLGAGLNTAEGGSLLLSSVMPTLSGAWREGRTPVSSTAVCSPCVRVACTGVCAGHLAAQVTSCLSSLSSEPLGPCLWAHAQSWFWREYREYTCLAAGNFGASPPRAHAALITLHVLCTHRGSLC